MKTEKMTFDDLEFYFPEAFFEDIESKFYHASVEFRKLKEYRAELDKKRGHECPWGAMISQESWVHRIRREWGQNPPKCKKKRRGNPGFGFMRLFKAWIFAPFFGAVQNAESVAQILAQNTELARICGFKKIDEKKYKLPAARTLRHFNQIMYLFDLWGDAKRKLVMINIEKRVYDLPDTLIIDPTHLDGFASVRKEKKACRICSKKEDCGFVQYTCSLTGIVSKSDNYKLPGLKGTLVCLPGSEVIIDAKANAGQTHDSQFLTGILMQVDQNYPPLRDQIDKILADAAFDSKDCREITEKIFQAQLITSINPRGRKDIAYPARGIKKIDPYGVPHCVAGHALKLACKSEKEQCYIWVCPVHNVQHYDPSLSCSLRHKGDCSPQSENGRVYRVDRETTPQINWENPQHLVRVEKQYDLRTGVERAISRAKRVLNFERAYCRGPKASQAHCDRLVVIIQLVAYTAWMSGKKDQMRRLRFQT